MSISPDFPRSSGDSLPDLAEGFRLAEWDVDPRRNRARRDGHVEQIEPKVMQVLLVLARHAGEPVTRDFLMETVWPDVIVTDDTLTRCVSEARKIFDRPAPDEAAGGDGAARGHRRSSIIETIPKVGYSLIVPVEPRSGVRKRRSRSPENVVVRPGITHESPSSKQDTRVSRGLLVIALVVVACGAVLAGRRLAADDSDAAFPSLGNPMPATSLAGVESMPDWSPGGGKIAFIHTPESGDTSVLMAGAPGDPRPLELLRAPRGAIRSPVWMPDGRTVLYVRSENGECIVRSIPALGGPPTDVAPCSGRFTSIDVSPDGRFIAMDSWPAPDAPVRIEIVTLSTNGRQQIPNDFPERHDYDPAFSPDGTRVLFARSLGEGQMDLFLFDLKRGSVERLTTLETGIAGHDWIDEKRILVSTGLPGNVTLSLLDTDSGDVRTLAPGGTRPAVVRTHLKDTNGDVRSTGSVRVVYETRQLDSDIAVADANGTRNVCGSTRNDRFPVLDPSGGSVVFISDRSGTPELYRCDLLSGTVTREGSGSHEAILAPQIGPDGRIVYTAIADGQADVFVIDRPDEPPRRLTPASSNDVYPFWSPAGRWIWFGSDRSGGMEIWRMPVGGGDAERMTDGGGLIGRLSPDGRTLWYQKVGAAGLWRQDTPGTGTGTDASNEGDLPIPDPVPELVDTKVDLSTMFAWMPVAGGVLIASRGSDGASWLERVDVRSGTRQTVRRLTDQRLSYGLSASRDESVLVFSVLERIDSDLMTATFGL